jgi:hypothetical protein
VRSLVRRLMAYMGRADKEPPKPKHPVSTEAERREALRRLEEQRVRILAIDVAVDVHGRGR